MGVIVSTGICVVLPVLIIWLTTRAKTIATNRKYDLLHAAIEKGVAIDPNLLLDPKKESRSIKMQLLGKLQWGIILLIAGIILGLLCIFENIRVEIMWVFGLAIAVGLALIAIYFIGRSDLKKEIEQEESRK